MAQKCAEPPTRPRGRPRKFDEAQVVAAAKTVFWDNGYAATSLNEIAEATGLNRPSLHAAFGDKHDLYRRALAETRTESVDGIEKHLAGDRPLRDALNDFFTDAAANTLEGDLGPRGCFVVCTAVTEALKDAETRAIAAGYVTDVDRIFRERFERSAGELAIGIDPAMAAAIAAAMLQTLAVRARTGSTRDELKAIVRAAVIAVCGPAEPESLS